MVVCQQSRRRSKPALTPCRLSSLRVVLSPLRCSTRGASWAFIQGPVQPGAPEASGGLPAPVCRALLQGREPDPPQWCRQTFTGTQCCHPGPGPERPVRHRPGPTGDWERSDQHAYTHGEWTCKVHDVGFTLYVQSNSGFFFLYTCFCTVQYA